MKPQKFIEYVLAVYLVICPWIFLGLHWIYGFDRHEAVAIVVAIATSGMGLFMIAVFLEEVVD